MRTNTFAPTKSNLAMINFRQRLSRIHGILLLLVALVAGTYSTIARYFGVGPYGFLQQDPLTWNGLIQAYLLMTILAGLIWLGAGEAKTRRWNVVGALAHLPPLLAVIFSWAAIQSAELGTVATVSPVFHLG